MKRPKFHPQHKIHVRRNATITQPVAAVSVHSEQSRHPPFAIAIFSFKSMIACQYTWKGDLKYYHAVGNEN